MYHNYYKSYYKIRSYNYYYTMYLNLLMFQRVCCVLTRGRIFYRISLRDIIIRSTCTMAKTTLITKFTYALFEESTSDNIARTISRSCHCLIDICIVSSHLRMAIPTVVSLTASTILEISEIENAIIVVWKIRKKDSWVRILCVWNPSRDSQGYIDGHIRQASIFILLYSYIATSPQCACC